jgi:hypothetical protein
MVCGVMVYVLLYRMDGLHARTLSIIRMNSDSLLSGYLSIVDFLVSDAVLLCIS